MWADKCHTSSVWKGMVAGAIGGLIGGWTMNRFQSVVGKVFADEEYSENAHSPKQSGRRQTILTEQHDDDGEDAPATVKVASTIAAYVSDRILTADEKTTGGSLVHYVFSATAGAAFGTMAEFVPAIQRGVGIPFGVSVWVAADQVMLPMMGLSKPPTNYPFSKHAYSLTSHFVYGITTAAAKRAMRHTL
jgi:hypothetical protein